MQANYSTRPKMGDFEEVDQPWKRIYVDFLGPFRASKMQNKYLLIVMDRFSRFVLLKPLRQVTTAKLIEFLDQQVFCLFSLPEKQFSLFLDKYGIKHMKIPKYSPQANAFERANRTILASVRAYIQSDQKLWDAHIQEIAIANPQRYTY